MSYCHFPTVLIAFAPLRHRSRFGGRLLRPHSQTEEACLVTRPQHGGARSGDPSLPLLAHRAGSPTSSSLFANKKHVRSWLLRSSGARLPTLPACGTVGLRRRDGLHGQRLRLKEGSDAPVLCAGAGIEAAEGDRQPERVRVAWIGWAVAGDLVDAPQSVANGIGVNEQRACGRFH
jgi:hypothetical protein